MSLRLYATEYPTQLPSGLFDDLLYRLPDHLRKRIVRFRRWQDAHAALLGKHLLRIALQQAGVSDDLTQLRYTPQDRPWLPNAPDFNISHSGTRVLCILGTAGRVGIDIEEIKPIAFQDFQTQFTPGEWTAILSDPDPAAGFFRFWTAKESLIKADGRGLNIPLREIDLSRAHTLSLDGVWWSVHPLTRFPGYACHFTVLASPGSKPPVSASPGSADLQPASPGAVPPPPIEFHDLTINEL